MAEARIGVVIFPGTCETSTRCTRSSICGGEPVALWHADDDLRGVDGVVLPGGFAHGDYLRTGAIARFSPVMARGRARSPPPAARSSASATASRCSARRACCPARCGKNQRPIPVPRR